MIMAAGSSTFATPRQSLQLAPAPPSRCSLPAQLKIPRSSAHSSITCSFSTSDDQGRAVLPSTAVLAPCTTARRAAAGRAQRAGAQCHAALQDGLPREQAQLVDQLSTVTSYVQLQAWLSQHQATTESQQEKSGLDAEAAVLAFVRAAELAPSLQFVALEDGEPEALTEELDARTAVCTALTPGVIHALPSLPLDTVALCARAAAELGEDVLLPAGPNFYTAVAQRVLHPPSTSSDGATASSRSDNNRTHVNSGTQSSSSTTGSTPAGTQPSTTDSRLDCRAEVLGLNLDLLCTAFARAGHYDSELMRLLCQEAAAVASSLDPGTLASIVCAMHELQHYDKALLAAAGVALLSTGQTQSQSQGQQRGSNNGGSQLALARLTPQEAAATAAAYSFFAVQNNAFYQVLLARASALPLDDASPQDLEQLWIARELATRTSAGRLAEGAGTSALTSLLDQAVARDLRNLEEGRERERSLVLGEASVQELVEYRALQLLQLRQLLGIMRAAGLLRPRPRSTSPGPSSAQGQQQGQGPEQQEEDPEGDPDQWRGLLHVTVTPKAPWSTIPLAIPIRPTPEGEDFAPGLGIVLLPPSAYCTNDPSRLRGTVQARLRCFQKLGWVLWPLRQTEWQEVVTGAAVRAGVQLEQQQPQPQQGTQGTAGNVQSAQQDQLTISDEEGGVPDLYVVASALLAAHLPPVVPTSPTSSTKSGTSDSSTSDSNTEAFERSREMMVASREADAEWCMELMLTGGVRHPGPNPTAQVEVVTSMAQELSNYLRSNLQRVLAEGASSGAATAQQG